MINLRAPMPVKRKCEPDLNNVDTHESVSSPAKKVRVTPNPRKTRKSRSTKKPSKEVEKSVQNDCRIEVFDKPQQPTTASGIGQIGHAADHVTRVQGDSESPVFVESLNTGHSANELRKLLTPPVPAPNGSAINKINQRQNIAESQKSVQNDHAINEPDRDRKLSKSPSPAQNGYASDCANVVRESSNSNIVVQNSHTIDSTELPQHSSKSSSSIQNINATSPTEKPQEPVPDSNDRPRIRPWKRTDAGLAGFQDKVDPCVVAVEDGGKVFRAILFSDELFEDFQAAVFGDRNLSYERLEINTCQKYLIGLRQSLQKASQKINDILDCHRNGMKRCHVPADEANLQYLENFESRLYDALDAVAKKENEEQILFCKAIRDQNVRNWRVDKVLVPVLQASGVIDQDPGEPEPRELEPPFEAGLLNEYEETKEHFENNRLRLAPRLRREQQQQQLGAQQEELAEKRRAIRPEVPGERSYEPVPPRDLLSPTHEEELETTDMEWVRGWAEEIIPDEEAIATAPDAESLWGWEPAPFQELETWDSISAKAVEEERRLIDSWRGQCEALRSPPA